jgi:hypothetical protein
MSKSVFCLDTFWRLEVYSVTRVRSENLKYSLLLTFGQHIIRKDGDDVMPALPPRD